MIEISPAVLSVKRPHRFANMLLNLSNPVQRLVLVSPGLMRTLLVQLLIESSGSVQRHRRRCRERSTKNDASHHAMISSLSPDAFEPTREPFSTQASVGESSSPMARDTCDDQPSSELPELSKPRLPDLSFILHPAHETSSPSHEQTADAPRSPSIQERHLALDQACLTLGLKHEAPGFL